MVYTTVMETMTRETPLSLVFATMEAQGRTQTWLARQLGVTKGQITHYKVGRRTPSDQEVRRAHELLGLPYQRRGGAINTSDDEFPLETA